MATHHSLHSSVSSSSLLQRERQLYRELCTCTARVQDRAHTLFSKLDRVLVFDLRFRWWGLGNNLIRWLGLIRIGLATGRATFLWFEGGQKGSERFFDLGEYFVAQGFDWSWTPSVEQRVRERMSSFNESSPTYLYHRCLKSGLICERHELSWQALHAPKPTARRHTAASTPIERVEGTEADERNGSVLRLLTTHAARWLVVRPRRIGAMTAFQPSGAPAAAVLSGQAGAGWSAYRDAQGLDGWQGTCWDAANATRRTRDTFAPATMMELPRSAAEAMAATEPVGGRALRSRISLRCEAFAALRPRAHLQEQIAPIVWRLEALRKSTGSMTGVHLRTGYPDWVALSYDANARATRPEWRAAALRVRERALSHEEHWRELEGYFEQCAPPPGPLSLSPRPLPVHSSAQRPSPEQGGAVAIRPCYLWTYPQLAAAPTVADALRVCGPTASHWRGACVRSQGCRPPSRSPSPAAATIGVDDASHAIISLQLPSNGTLSAAAVCAARLRGGRAPAVGHAALLVLGDAPGVVSLLQQHPTLSVASTSSGGRLAHTQFDRACDGGRRLMAQLPSRRRHEGRSRASPMRTRLDPPGGAPMDATAARGAAVTCTSGRSDPEGGWTRTAVDFYVGGLVDAFLSVLDTTFVDGAVLLRSLSCCARHARVHFSAASSSKASNRDRPMAHTGFLSALMRDGTASVTQHTGVDGSEEWPSI